MPDKPRFAIIGAAGFVARRHLQAIRDVGGELVLACDSHDSAGIIDAYNLAARFCSSEDAFWPLVKELAVDFVAVCTPNDLHFRHARMACDAGARVILEKPATLNREQAEALARFGDSVSCILQLRLLARKLGITVPWIKTRATSPVLITYHTPRGEWYRTSWKCDKARSGGLVFNIGTHPIDLAVHLFGPPVEPPTAEFFGPEKAHISLNLECAQVYLDLGIGRDTRPSRAMMVPAQFNTGQTLYEFAGFTDLHTESYREILAGRGFTLNSCLETIRACELLARNDPGFASAGAGGAHATV